MTQTTHCSSHKPRIGVIGGGHLGRIHARLLAANSTCELIGVADPSAESRALVESQLRLPTIADYSDWESIADAVVIAAPTFLHHSIGSWCLEHGIHVLMEKPIASSLREAQHLVRLSKENNCVLQVGHVERFNAVWQLANTELDSSSVRYIEAAREGTYTGRSTDIGIVMDLMIHDIDLILSLVKSEVVAVQAHGWNVLGEHEDFATAHLTFRNGTLAQLRASRIAPVARRCMQLHCDEELIEIDFATSQVKRTRPHADVLDGTRQADQLPPAARAKVKDHLFEEWLQQSEQTATATNAIEHEQAEFLSAVTQGTLVSVDGAQASEAVAVAALILDQIAINRPARSIIPAAARFRRNKAA